MASCLIRACSGGGGGGRSGERVQSEEEEDQGIIFAETALGRFLFVPSRFDLACGADRIKGKLTGARSLEDSPKAIAALEVSRYPRRA